MSVDATAVGVAAEPAPLGGWRRAVADTLLVGGSTVGCHLFGALTSLALRFLIDPAQMGVWQGVKLFLSYANYTNLGVSKGAAQELAMARGRGDVASAQRGLDLAHTVNTLTSGFYALVLAVAALWIWVRGGGPWSNAWAMGLLTIGPLAILQRHVTFKVTLLRSLQQFGTTSQLNLLEAALTLLLSAVAVWLCGWWGLFLATAAILLASLVFLSRHQAPELAWAWNWLEIRRLVGVGGPILAAGVISSLFRSLDKLLILVCFSDKEYQLGCYSLALLVAAQLYGLANMISTVMGPRYSELLGRTENPREVARLAARATEVQTTLLALPAALAILAAGPILGRLLPEYQHGLPALVWMPPAVLAVGMGLPASQFLIAAGRGQRLLAVLLVSIVVALACQGVAHRYDLGLLGVALTMLAANSFYLVLLTSVSIIPQLNGPERVRYGAVLAGTWLGSILLAMAVHTSAEHHSWDAAGIATGSLLAVAAWAAVVGCGWRCGGWSTACRKKGVT